MADLQKKEEFLTFILENETFSRREVAWILHYIKNHSPILERVHFVEKAERTPRGIRFSPVQFNKNTPITLFYEGRKFFDIDHIFHEIRLHWQQPLFVEIVFDQPWQNELFLEVLEENPYALWNETMDEDLEKEMAETLKEWHDKKEQETLLKEINLALDAKDEERFKELTAIFQKHQEENKQQA